MTDEIKYQVLEERIAHLKEVYENETRATKYALELQAKEYERRLEALNGEANKLHDMQISYLPRETFDGFKEVAQGEMRKLETWQSTMNGKLIVLGALLGVLMFLLNYFKQ